jgi:hypothetical protein
MFKYNIDCDAKTLTTQLGQLGADCDTKRHSQPLVSKSKISKNPTCQATCPFPFCRYFVSAFMSDWLLWAIQVKGESHQSASRCPYLV